MRCPSLRILACFVSCTIPLVLTGCYSMNGYMTNASGQSYYDQGNYAMAAREFQSAVASNPTNPDYMANLAKTKIKMGDTNGAEQLYRQVLTRNPDHQPSYHGYAEMLVAQGRQHDAQRMLKTWAATQPYIAESHVELAWLHREMGQHDAAAQSLQTALQINPSHSTALAHLGQHYQDSGQNQQAMSMYQRSLQSDWNQPDVQSRLAALAPAVGADHPMNQVAMSRGVHPQNIPRQQMAFGPPASGTMPQMVFGPQPAPYQMSQPNPMMASTPLPQSASMPVQPMMPTFSGSTDAIMIPGDASGTTPILPDPTKAAASPAPTPDPAFGNASPPSTDVTTVSQSAVIPDELPEVDAF